MEGMIVWNPGVTLDAVEKQVILAAFRFYRGNKTATANALGIAIRTLDNKLEKYELDGKAEKERQENERSRREDFLRRARGESPGYAATAAPTGNSGEREADARQGQGSVGGSESGVRLESTAGPSQESAMPMSQRSQVQTVLPAQASKGSAGKGR